MTTVRERKTDVRPYLWMVCAAVAFAAMAELAYVARLYCPWQVIALARSIVPLVISGGMLAAAGIALPFPSPRTLWSRSIAGSISLVCTFYALTQLPASDVLTLSNLVPLWVALFSIPLLGVRPPASLWASVVVGVLGVALSQQEYMLEGKFASLIAVIASLSSAVALVSLHRVVGYDPRAIVFHFSAVSLTVCLAASVRMPTLPPGSLLHPEVWALLAGVGISATIGQYFLTKAYMTGNPARVSVVGLSQVAFAMLLDLWISELPFTLVRVTGLLMVVGSTAWVMLHRAAAEDGPALDEPVRAAPDSRGPVRDLVTAAVPPPTNPVA